MAQTRSHPRHTYQRSRCRHQHHKNQSQRLRRLLPQRRQHGDRVCSTGPPRTGSLRPTAPRAPGAIRGSPISAQSFRRSRRLRRAYRKLQIRVLVAPTLAHSRTRPRTIYCPPLRSRQLIRSEKGRSYSLTSHKSQKTPLVRSSPISLAACRPIPRLVLQNLAELGASVRDGS